MSDVPSKLGSHQLKIEEERTITCPDHPDVSMTAIEQQTHTQLVKLTVLDDGSIEIEPIGSGGVFVQDMASSVTVAYKCGVPECDFMFPAHKLGDIAKEQHASE